MRSEVRGRISDLAMKIYLVCSSCSPVPRIFDKIDYDCGMHSDTI